MVYSIKAAIIDPAAQSYTFAKQQTIYGGKSITAGSEIFLFARENDGGVGRIDCCADQRPHGVQTTKMATDRNAPRHGRVGRKHGAFRSGHVPPTIGCRAPDSHREQRPSDFTPPEGESPRSFGRQPQTRCAPCPIATLWPEHGGAVRDGQPQHPTDTT